VIHALNEGVFTGLSISSFNAALATPANMQTQSNKARRHLKNFLSDFTALAAIATSSPRADRASASASGTRRCTAETSQRDNGVDDLNCSRFHHGCEAALESSFMLCLHFRHPERRICGNIICHYMMIVTHEH
jgi:hypothetical protein